MSKKYLVTITKEGVMEIDAETEEEARAIAEGLESEAAFEMDIQIDVEKLE